MHAPFGALDMICHKGVEGDEPPNSRIEPVALDVPLLDDERDVAAIRALRELGGPPLELERRVLAIGTRRSGVERRSATRFDELLQKCGSDDGVVLVLEPHREDNCDAVGSGFEEKSLVGAMGLSHSRTRDSLSVNHGLETLAQWSAHHYRADAGELVDSRLSVSGRN